jgi:hypothetical protein
MARRVLTYCAAFLSGLGVWFAFEVLKAINPALPWQYPGLGLVIGMTFPGGAPPGMHYLSHVAQTWVPFLISFLVAYVLTGRTARLSGAAILYLAFLAWSYGMLILAGLGVGLDTVFVVGLAGTFLGGLGLYLRLVSPARKG